MLLSYYACEFKSVKCSVSEASNVADHDLLKQQISKAIDSIADKEDHQENFVTGLKNDILPPKSTFLLVIQTKLQKELLLKYGNTISMMDAIYHTTKYGFPIFL